MFIARRVILNLNPKNIRFVKMSSLIGEMGSRAGKSVGGGGRIRADVGSFGKIELILARDEQFFYKQRKEQLKNLKIKSAPETSPKKH